jgi:hypothetical protein
MNKVEYDSQQEGPTTTYQMIDEDARGLVLDQPYLGISIDGSPFVPVHEIINRALDSASLVLKPLDIRMRSNGRPIS